LETLSVTAAHEGGKYGGWQTGTRVAISAGTYKGMPAAWCYGHLNDFTVAVGQWVNEGDLIGHQGSTGDSTGPHLHLNFFVGMQYYDPLPFLDGRSKTIPDEIRTSIAVLARYKITESGVRLRSSPLTTAPEIGKTTVGQIIDVSELVFDDEKTTWANTGAGYCAIYDGATPWAVPVAPVVPDTSAELAEAKNEIVRQEELVAELTNANNELVTANTNLTAAVDKTQSENNRLGNIIDAGAAELAKK
jgi:hypothetical protein